MRLTRPGARKISGGAANKASKRWANSRDFIRRVPYSLSASASKETAMNLIYGILGWFRWRRDATAIPGAIYQTSAVIRRG